VPVPLLGQPVLVRVQEVEREPQRGQRLELQEVEREPQRDRRLELLEVELEPQRDRRLVVVVQRHRGQLVEPVEQVLVEPVGHLEACRLETQIQV